VILHGVSQKISIKEEAGNDIEDKESKWL